MKTVVFTFGRMNPPTVGHERLVKTVAETARKVGGDHVIYLSQTCASPTDPLEWNFKRRVCESAFPGVNISRDILIKTPFQALKYLGESYNKVILVVGSDQVKEFADRMTPYAKEWHIDFEIISAGERISESEGVEGMSASKLRQLALEGKAEKFYEGLPKNLSLDVKKLVFQRVIEGLHPKTKGLLQCNDK